MLEQRAAMFTKRSIKTASKLAGLRLAMSMLDLTSLEGKDSPEKVRALCRKAIRPFEGNIDPPIPSVAAVCVYPALVAIASGNVIAPYEIETSEDERRRALENLAGFLQYPYDRGKATFDAVIAARKTIAARSSWLWFLTAVAGVLLILSGPIGLALAAPAGLAGGQLS